MAEVIDLNIPTAPTRIGIGIGCEVLFADEYVVVVRNIIEVNGQLFMTHHTEDL